MRKKIPSAALAAALVLSSFGPGTAAWAETIARPALPGLPVLPALAERPLPESPRTVLSSFMEGFRAVVGLSPVLSAMKAAPQAPAGPAAPSARASLGELAAGGPGNGPNKEGHDRVYDSGKRKDTAAVEADYTAEPPALPLEPLSPSWREAQGPSAPDLVLHSAAGERADLDEGALSAEEDLRIVAEQSSSLRDETPDDQRPGLGRRLLLEPAGGLRQAALLPGGTVAWIDSAGKVRIFEPGRPGGAALIAPPLGPAEQLAASTTGRYLYVKSGAYIERWDLEEKKATVLLDERLSGLEVVEMRPQASEGMQVVTSKGVLSWSLRGLSWTPGAPAEVRAADGAAAPVLRSAGRGLYIESLGPMSRVWAAEGEALRHVGTLPFEVKAAARAKDGRILAVTDKGLAEWEPSTGRYRRHELPGLSGAALASGVRLDIDRDGTRALVTAGGRLVYAELGAAKEGELAREAQIQLWSEQNPMFIKDGLLHIGAFAYPVKKRFALAAVPWYKRLLLKLLRKPMPVKQVWPPVSAVEWKALNLPSNKLALYETLKSFSLGQDTLYIGETGGGKTWMATTLAHLVGLKLYVVSFTEYTKNQDLIARDTFGEEGRNKTGKTLATVLQWLDDPEDSLLLLDEIHKPLEGVAALNNILQNRAYNLGGRAIKGDRATKKVIGTMNPVKPPYKGEPPSGELSSRFGTTLQVNYLPPAEETALLSIFHEGVSQRVLRKLVDIARDLRRIYPEVLPLPISSRTLLFVTEKIKMYPQDDPAEAFRSTYNPGTIVEDPSIAEAIEKALAAHDLKAERAAPDEKKRTEPSPGGQLSLFP